VGTGNGCERRMNAYALEMMTCLLIKFGEHVTAITDYVPGDGMPRPWIVGRTRRIMIGQDRQVCVNSSGAVVYYQRSHHRRNGQWDIIRYIDANGKVDRQINGSIDDWPVAGVVLTWSRSGGWY
jgi:hypothetical protein